MIDARYKRLSGPHAGQIYMVLGPSSEIEHPIHWVLHNADKGVNDQAIVLESELHDPKLWQPLP